jgi:hypothetical protein
MPWYGFYSEKQEKLFGYANYLNIRGQLVNVTEFSQNPNHKPDFPNYRSLSQLTHFCGVQKRNHTKARSTQASIYMCPQEMTYDHSGKCSEPCKISN